MPVAIKTFCVLLILALGSLQAAQLAYIPNSFSGTMSVIDTASNAVVGTVSVGNQRFGVAITPDGTRVYVAHNTDTVSVINAVTNTVTATITTADTATFITMNPSGTRVYVSTQTGVSVIDPASNTVIGKIGLSNAGSAVVHPNGTRLYVISAAGISVVDTATNVVTATIGGAAARIRLAINPSRTRLYATNFATFDTSVIDTTTNTVVGTLKGGGAPVNVTTNSAGDRVYLQTNSGLAILMPPQTFY